MQAPERSYDGIIIGAGHHGLVLGAYLAKAGLQVLLVERRLTYGGGLSTREVTAARLLSQSAFDQPFPHQRAPWFAISGSTPG